MKNDSTTTLFGIKNPLWWKQEGDGTLLNTSYCVYALTLELPPLAVPGPRIFLIFNHNHKFVLVYESADMLKVANRIIARTKRDPHYAHKLYIKWKSYRTAFYKIVEMIKTLPLKTLSNRELALWYKKFDRAYKKEYGVAILTDFYAEYAEKILLPKIQEYVKTLAPTERNEASMVLLGTTTPSFIKKSEWSLQSILGCIKKYPALVKLLCSKETITFSDLTKWPKVAHALKKHTQKYYFLANNYAYSYHLDEDYFIHELKKQLATNYLPIVCQEQARFRKLKKLKMYYIKKLGLPFEIQRAIEILDLWTYWQDQRKQANMIANGIIDDFLNVFHQRTNIDYWLLKYLSPDEFRQGLKIGRVDLKTLKERRQWSVTVGYAKRVYVLAGEKAEALYKKMFPAETKAVKHFPGIVASRGYARGKVRIITSSSHFARLQKGEILVASMTRPDYAPILRKAKAIITDEGGLTCHAAIISRELGIPCIIGTKIATQVLKDGDWVEVDAEKGLVKLLSKFDKKTVEA